MSHVIFDTLAFVKKLKQSGFAENQAEALSEAFKEAQKTAIDDLATKADIKELQQTTKIDIKELDLKIENKLAKIEGEITLIKWMLGFVLAANLSILVKILF